MRSFWWVVVVVLVGTAAFAGGWIAKPARQPDGGGFDQESTCEIGPGDSATQLRGPWVYRPGQDGAQGVFHFERQGDEATLYVLEGRLPDDEAEAKVERYRLSWSVEAGWQVVECEAALRSWPDRR